MPSIRNSYRPSEVARTIDAQRSMPARTKPKARPAMRVCHYPPCNQEAHVDNYCTAQHARAHEKYWETLTCARSECGATFDKERTSVKRFCSRSCAAKSVGESYVAPPAICERDGCDGVITGSGGSRYRQRFCSRACVERKYKADLGGFTVDDILDKLPDEGCTIGEMVELLCLSSERRTLVWQRMDRLRKAGRVHRIDDGVKGQPSVWARKLT